ncbi:DUF4974 domain-containing protein [Arachidicoccus ginsenosidivorans]|uniref:DUF4974 domain-containing protein n=2 Tax=Arachidicoccus ginsenosidivorans TaxID=496057 RepID=A0A5B8VL65_9BACT|nr:DUF4974 domain-containing protein [Arachidicoccus ginsenosidivorans]
MCLRNLTSSCKLHSSLFLELIFIMTAPDNTYWESLAQKALAGQATEQELNLLLEGLSGQNGADLQQVLDKLLGITEGEDEHQINQLLSAYKQTPKKYSSIVDKVLESDKISEPPKVLKVSAKNGRSIYWYRAAVILLVCALGVLITLSIQKGRQSVIHKMAKNPSVDYNIVPGKDKAILTLANGKKILLDSAANGVLADQNGVDIHKVQNGQLIYTANESTAPDATGSGIIAYNTMTTPRGGKYQLVLPDGTKVWLNADSRIKYPTRFTGANRIISMVGEAYFEVAKDAKHPFIVETSRGMNVRVLGTHFNICDYPDQPVVRTTLLEGSVRVIYHSDSLMIVPGQQATMAIDGSLATKSNIDLDRVVAWKNGLFYFDQMDIVSIMQALSRWYDIDVHYAGKQPTDLFSAIMNRDNDIHEILSMLEATEKVHFKITGRTIEVLSGK